MSRERTCIVTRELKPETALIRFVADPEDRVFPDLAAKLPGRGLWVSSDREALVAAVKKNAFARAQKAPLKVGMEADAFADFVADLMRQRLLDGVGIAKRAGQLVHGRMRVEEKLRAGAVGLLIEARDGAEDGKRKLRAKAGDVPRLDCLSVEELSLALGAENVVHAALDPGSLAQRLCVDGDRLAGLEGKNPAVQTDGSQI